MDQPSTLTITLPPSTACNDVVSVRTSDGEILGECDVDDKEFPIFFDAQRREFIRPGHPDYESLLGKPWWQRLVSKLRTIRPK